MQVAVRHERVNGQQLDGSDSQRADIVDDRLVTKPLIRPLQFFRHAGMLLCVALHMKLVQDRLIPVDAEPAQTRRLAAPVELRIQNHAFRHGCRTVALVKGGVVVRFELVPEDGRLPCQLADVGRRIWVEQKLVVIEAVPVSGIIRSINAISVDRARHHALQVPVPDLVGVFRKHNAGLFAPSLRVKQTQLHFCGVLGKQREIGTSAIPYCPSQGRTAFTQLEALLFAHCFLRCGAGAAQCMNTISATSSSACQPIRTDRRPDDASGRVCIFTKDSA